MPDVSVVLSTHARNHGDSFCPNLLRRAIDSVLNQTYRDFEFVIIDDGSEDGSSEVITQYAEKDSRIKAFRRHPASGIPAKVYNEAIRLSSGKHISMMFDDDTIEPHFIETLFPAIDSSAANVGMVHGLADLINMRKPEESIKNFGMAPISVLLQRNVIAQVSAMIKRSTLEKIGGLDESPVLARINDWDLWLRVYRKFTILAVQKKVATAFVGTEGAVGLTFPLDSEAAKKYMESNRTLPSIKK